MYWYIILKPVDQYGKCMKYQMNSSSYISCPERGTLNHLKFFATLLTTFLFLITFRYNFLFFCFNNLSNSLITIIWKLYACLGLFVLLILLFVVIYERRNMHWQYTKWCILVKQEWNGRTDQMLIKYVCIHFNKHKISAEVSQ